MKAPMRRVPVPVISVLVVAALTAIFSALTEAPLWVSSMCAAACLLLNGLAATLEDDLPGGFNNPYGTRTPRYVAVSSWIIRGVGVLLAILCLWALWPTRPG